MTAIVALLIFSAFAQAQIKITGDTKVDQYKLVRLTVEGASDNAAVLWDYDEDTLDGEQSNRKIVFVGPPGTYKVKATSITLDKDGRTKVEVAKVTVTIGAVGPKPPEPGPGPKPPDPPEPKDDAPIKAPGNRVLIVYESAELPKLPKAQLNQLYSKALRDWLEEKCVKDKDNPKGAWRMWDKDVDTSAESKIWQDAMKRDRKSVPWLIISNGSTGYEGPLPEDPDKTMDLLKKYIK